MTNHGNTHTTIRSLGRSTSLIRLAKMVCAALLALSLLSLSACSRNKVIASVDDSAEYRNARALPPLTKPNQNRAATETTAASGQETNASVELDDSQTQSASAEPATTRSEATSTAVTDTFDVANTVAVIEPDGDVAKLRVEADFDQTWAYLTQRLTGSEVTVFSRNKTAGRIAIGCAEIGTNEDVEVKRVGRWSIFSRKKSRVSEYCALQAFERKGQTMVSVLDRAGDEAPVRYSQLILQRILNN